LEDHNGTINIKKIPPVPDSFSLVIAAPPGDDDTILGKWELDPEIFKKALAEEGLEGEELELATTAAEAVSMIFEFNEDGTFQCPCPHWRIRVCGWRMETGRYSPKHASRRFRRVGCSRNHLG
jgi:hypothetical protein